MKLALLSPEKAAYRAAVESRGCRLHPFQVIGLDDRNRIAAFLRHAKEVRTLGREVGNVRMPQPVFLPFRRLP